MIIQLDKIYKEDDDYHVIEQKIDHTDDDPLVSNIINRKFLNLTMGLVNTYTTHSDLYTLITGDNKYLTGRYDPDSSRFSQYNTGWKNFCKDITERELQTFTEIYTDVILELIEYVNEQFRNQSHSTVETGLIKNREVARLNQLHFNESMMVISNDQVYEMELKAVEGVESLDDIQENIYKSIKDDTIKQQEVKIKNAEKKNDQLRVKLNKEKDDMFVDVITNADEVLGDWEFYKEPNGELWFKHKTTIKTDKVAYNGRLYDYNREACVNPDNFKELYIMGLKVRAKNHVINDDIKATRGFNLHFTGTSTCIGELSGSSLLKVIKELPKTLKIANMNSVLNSTVKQYLNNNFMPTIREEDAPEGIDTNAWVTRP